MMVATAKGHSDQVWMEFTGPVGYAVRFNDAWTPAITARIRRLRVRGSSRSVNAAQSEAIVVGQAEYGTRSFDRSLSTTPEPEVRRLSKGTQIDVFGPRSVGGP